MTSKIAIVSPSGPELVAIRNHLANPARFSLREFRSLDEVNQGLRSYPFEVLVIRLPIFDTPQVSTLLRLRQIFPKAGLITVSPDIQPGARYQIRELVHHKLLHEATELPDLQRVAEKFVKGEVNATRLHPRVRRDGDCELFDPTSRTRIRGRFVDFAQMGARLLVNSRVPLRQNMRIELHYQSTTEIGRLQRIESNVVWVEDCGNKAAGTFDFLRGSLQEVGLRFIAAL